MGGRLGEKTDRMQWEVLLTTQVEAFLDDLYEADRDSHRILFVFDPWRSAILLVAGDKAGQWSRWCRTALPEAEQLYAIYLKEREQEAGDGGG